MFSKLHNQTIQLREQNSVNMTQDVLFSLKSDILSTATKQDI